MKELVKMETPQVQPLLVDGEDSSPSCLRMLLEIARADSDANDPEEATLSVHLVDDPTIGYFRGGKFKHYTHGGAQVELSKDSPADWDEPETQIFFTEGFSERIVAPLRNENGKISPQGLKTLGEMAIYEYLVHTDL